MKVIKVGTYRITLMIALVTLSALSGYLLEPIAFLMTGLLGLTWVIFEVNIVLQAILGIQRMLAYLMQPPDKTAKQVEKGAMEIEAPDVKLIDINSGVSNEEKTSQKQ